MTYAFRIEAVTNVWRFFKTCLKNRHTLSNLANEEIVQRISYGSFRCCDVAVAFLAIRDTSYVRKPIRKCV